MYGQAISDLQLMEKAVKVIMKTGRALPSDLMSDLDYPIDNFCALKLIYRLEKLGIIGHEPTSAFKSRDILMDEESAFSILERARNGENAE